MSILSLIAFVAVLCGVYVGNVVLDRLVKKQWKFKPGFFTLIFAFCFAMISIYVSNMAAYFYVENNVEYHWKQEIISTQEIENIVRNREQEGSFFFGIGNMYERETLRFSRINKDGTRSRERIYTADCRFLKTDKKQERIEYVRNVRIYKNPADQVFFKNEYDVSDGFYKVYTL